jgi:hypothetical protein
MPLISLFAVTRKCGDVRSRLTILAGKRIKNWRAFVRTENFHFLRSCAPRVGFAVCDGTLSTTPITKPYPGSLWYCSLVLLSSPW